MATGCQRVKQFVVEYGLAIGRLRLNQISNRANLTGFKKFQRRTQRREKYGSFLDGPQRYPLFLREATVGLYTTLFQSVLLQ